MIGEVLAALATVLSLMAVVLVGPVVLARRRPQAGDKPVQIAWTPDGVVSLADVVAHLTSTGSTVAAEFLPPADRVDRRTVAAGGPLLVPDDVDVPVGTGGPMVLRTSRPDAVRRLEHGTRAALAREAARVRRAAYDQLLHDRRRQRGPHGSVDVRAAVPVQVDVPRPPPRPSPGRPTRQ